MDTLLLDGENWDLCVDASGHIALASNPYALAQGAACAVRAFAGENYYDTTQGVPYFEQILGRVAPLSLIKSHLTSAALSVPEVVKARVLISDISDRKLSGQVQVTDATGATQFADF